MGTKARHERLEPLIEEFNALSDTIWSPASKKKHAADFGRFLAWLMKTGRPPTTESLELATLLVYVKHLWPALSSVESRDWISSGRGWSPIGADGRRSIRPRP